MKKVILFLLINGMLFPWNCNVVMAQNQSIQTSESVVPANDPQLTGLVVQLNKDLMSAHPRLLFGPKDLPRLKEFYNSDKGKFYREGIEKMLPICKAPEKPQFLRDATDGQRQGLWRMPTVSLHYALTGDKKSFEKAMGYLTFLETLPEWESAPEINSGMSSANIMIGAALTFDLLYNDMPVDFREKFRKKLWYMARAQYYGGHLMKLPGVHYWQGDPQNNHRWHRDAGLLMALATAATGDASEAWMMRQAFNEMKFINDWLPEDGTSHEGATYLVFGATHLTLANNVCDRLFGTRYMQEPFYQNVNNFLLQSQCPGLTFPFQFGDSGGGSGSYGQFAFKAACENNQADQLAMLMEMGRVQLDFFMWHWMSIVWLDPNAKVGKIENLPKTSFFKDMGLAFIRDGWESKNIGAMFKCGPLGGYKLNEYRKAYAENGQLRGVNVAHDDPDANSFIIWSNGALVAETDRYSSRKQSSHHNTILINGMGQMVPGRMEPQMWSQPGPNDMREMAVVTAWKDAGNVVVCEGEASGSYLAIKQADKSRPTLDRYRRTFIWVKGSYLLVLDDIKAPEAVDITWLMQAPQLTRQGDKDLNFELKHKNASCGMQINQIGSVELNPVIGESPADNHNQGLLGWQQLQLKGHANALKLATLMTPWAGDFKVSTKPGADGSVQIMVNGDKVSDNWQWTPAKGKFEPSTLKGSRKGGFNVQVGEKDKVVVATNR
jgi:hypothetical protein